MRFFENNVVWSTRPFHYPCFVGVFQYHLRPPKHALEWRNYQKPMFLLLLGDHLLTTFSVSYIFKIRFRTYGIHSTFKLRLGKWSNKRVIFFANIPYLTDISHRGYRCELNTYVELPTFLMVPLDLVPALQLLPLLQFRQSLATDLDNANLRWTVLTKLKCIIYILYTSI